MILKIKIITRIVKTILSAQQIVINLIMKVYLFKDNQVQIKKNTSSPKSNSCETNHTDFNLLKQSSSKPNITTHSHGNKNSNLPNTN